MACQLGLDRIVLSNARKLLRDYFGSSLLRKPETLQGLLVEELMISSDVSLPHSIDNAATAAVYDRRSPLLHGRRRIGGDN